MNRLIKYLFNFGLSGLIAWGAFADFALWAAAPFGTSKLYSLRLLEEGIIEKSLHHILIGLAVIIGLALSTWFFFGKNNKPYNKTDLIIIITLNIIIIATGLFIGIINAHNGLSIEIERRYS